MFELLNTIFYFYLRVSVQPMFNIQHIVVAHHIRFQSPLQTIVILQTIIVLQTLQTIPSQTIDLAYNEQRQSPWSLVRTP